jgi:hypothetical protein
MGPYNPGECNMGHTSEYLLNDTRDKLGIRLITVWLAIFLLIGGILASQFFIQTIAAPVIIDEIAGGSWEDAFEDLSGVDVVDSLKLTENGIELDTNLFDNFTGNNGDLPDTSKWDLVDDGYTLEIQNNQLLSSAPSGDWKNEMVQTNVSFSINHTLTWKQNLHTNSGNALYYHFFILNGSGDDWIFGLDQNDVNQYQYKNLEVGTFGNIATSVSGWHDFKITYEESYIRFYFDGSLEYEYDFAVTSVKYQFGTRCLNGASTIYTDDILINSTMSGNLTSEEIFLPTGKTWEMLMLNKIEPSRNAIEITLLDGATFLPIPGFESISESQLDISTIDSVLFPTLRIHTHFISDGLASPILRSYNVSWVDNTPPATPSGFAVNNPFTGFSLIISWDPNLETDLNNYVLYYSTDNFTFYKLTNLSSDSISYIHYGRIINQTYYYKVAAADKVPNESPPTFIGMGTPDLDYDGDGVGNMDDMDDDNDGIPDTSDPFPFNPLNDIETKIDNIQNIVENLNITELTDAIDYLNLTLPTQVDELSQLLENITDLNTTDLLEYIQGMNASLYKEIQNLLTEITSDMNDMMARMVLLEGNLSAQHDAINVTISLLDDLISNEHALTRRDIMDVLNSTILLLESLDNNMTVHDSDIKNILATIDSLIANENNLTRAQLMDNITDILDQLDVVDQNILNEINDLNTSVSVQLTDLLNNITTNQNALRTWLEIVIPALGDNIMATNSTLHKQLDDLDTLINGFYNDLDSDLDGLISDLQTHNSSTGQDHSDIIDLLNGLADDVGNIDLDELKAMLLGLAQNLSQHDQAMADDIMGVISDIESFETSSQQKLDDINGTLDELVKLQNILSELEALQASLSEAEQQLQESIDEIPKEEEEKDAELGLVEMLLIIILIMLIVNIILSLLGSRKKGPSEPPSPPTQGYSHNQSPPLQPQAPIEHTPPPLEEHQIGPINENENTPMVPPPPPE